jgi:glycosyltransferase involved in cell wall biosynthesis
VRIGLNLLFLLPGVCGGTETYAAGLLKGLSECESENEYFVYVNRSARGWPLPRAGNFHRVVCPVNGSQRALRYLFEQVAFPLRLRRDKVELLHSLGYVCPLAAPCPSVVTIHDLNYRVSGTLMSPLRRRVLSSFVRWSALRCDHVIVPSEYSRQELKEGIPEAGNKATVIWEAAFARQESPVPELLAPKAPYAMAFGSLSLHKNIPRLIEAFERARERAAFPYILLLVGSAHKVASVSSDVMVIPRQPDGVVQSLIAGAAFFLIPSIYEGFGLPVLEAMSAGVPVACSTAGSLPEVAGNAALLFDPESVESIESAIVRMATDAELREELVDRGQANVKQFSWARAATETVDIYRKVIESNTTGGTSLRKRIVKAWWN